MLPSQPIDTMPEESAAPKAAAKGPSSPKRESFLKRFSLSGGKKPKKSASSDNLPGEASATAEEKEKATKLQSVGLVLHRDREDTTTMW